MAAADIIKDATLRSVIEAAEQAQQQCNTMLDFLDKHVTSTSTLQPSPSTASTYEEIETAFSKHQKVLFAHLSQVRGRNRKAIMGVRQTKQATAEARQEIDTLHLQLQNLYYEQQYLKGEIASCEAYEYVVCGVLAS